jgi:hypothetical protein
MEKIARGVLKSRTIPPEFFRLLGKIDDPNFILAMSSAELERMSTTVDISAAEAEFIASAKAYGERKGISYSAWREVGVSAAVLKQAGISRAQS